jgi:hypothetical protein
LRWLESVSPLEETNQEAAWLIESLDTLDGVLLSAIVELETIAESDLSGIRLEEELQRIWRRSYAHFASTREQALESIFVQRGEAVVNQIYPSSQQRRQLYYTSLPPRSGTRLLESYPEIREYLEAGVEYVLWDRTKRFNYIQGVAERIGRIPKFAPEDKPPGKADWDDLLRWWLDPPRAYDLDSHSLLSGQAPLCPSLDNIWKWYQYIRKSFTYKLNWGIGSLVALASHEAFGDRLVTPSVDEWTSTELPWIVFWLKELITWGTLEPVAAYLLARGRRRIATRVQAERIAKAYYEDQPTYLDPDDLLNARFIREWANDKLHVPSDRYDGSGPSVRIQATLLRDFSSAPERRWKVIPVQKRDEIHWVDPAGFLLAKSSQLSRWRTDWLHKFDFVLDHSQQVVLSSEYL